MTCLMIVHWEPQTTTPIVIMIILSNPHITLRQKSSQIPLPLPSNKSPLLTPLK